MTPRLIFSTGIEAAQPTIAIQPTGYFAALYSCGLAPELMEQPMNKSPINTGTTLAAQLERAHEIMKPEPARPKAVPTGKTRTRISVVRATGSGISTMHKTSFRASVLAYIQAQPDGTVNIDEAQKHFEEPIRGYIQKLIEKKHLEVVS